MPIVCALSQLVFRERLLPVTFGGNASGRRKSREGCRRLQAPKKLFGEERQTSSGFYVWVTYGGPSSRAGSQFVKRLDHSPFGMHGSKPYGLGQGQHHRVRGWTRAIEGGAFSEPPPWCGIGSGHGVMLHAKLAAELWLPAAFCAFTRQVWVPWVR